MSRGRNIFVWVLLAMIALYAVDRAIYIAEARERKAQAEKWGQRVDRGLELADDLFRRRK